MKIQVIQQLRRIPVSDETYDVMMKVRASSGRIFYVIEAQHGHRNSLDSSTMMDDDEILFRDPEFTWDLSGNLPFPYTWMPHDYVKEVMEDNEDALLLLKRIAIQ